MKQNKDYIKLDNGLRVLLHRDTSTPLVAVNMVYDVGSRDESPDQTGFAHLFEHLMFGGSAHIPVFDIPLQEAGGENNAFTSFDYTNYYMTLPARNIETAFWLESDRMGWLDVSETALEVQRKVVVEEFRQRCLNQPYGDAWHILRPMAYKVHPYMWPIIGKEIKHIENARQEDVRDFFKRYYNPSNAILSVAGNINPDNVMELISKWFGDIPSGMASNRSIQKEPIQTEECRKIHYGDVPVPAMYKVFHMPGRNEQEYMACDLLSDLLSGGRSSRLFQRLTKEKQIFSEINAYITGDIDPGLFVVYGKPAENVKIEDAEKAVLDELYEMASAVPERELEKVKNKFESNFLIEQMQVSSKAMALGYYTLLGDPTRLNTEVENYRSVTAGSIAEMAGSLFKPENSSTLWYLPGSNKEQ